MKQIIGRASLDSLKNQAKALLQSFQVGKELDRVTAVQHRPRGPLALHDAQAVIAREYGFPTWPRLKIHLEFLTLPQFEVGFALTEAAWDGQLARYQEAFSVWGAERPDWLRAIQGDTSLEFDPAMVRLPVGPHSRSLIVYTIYSRVSKPADRLVLTRQLLEAGADPNDFHLDKSWLDNPLSILYAASGR